MTLKKIIFKLADQCTRIGAFSLAFEKTNKVETVFTNAFDTKFKKNMTRILCQN